MAGPAQKTADRTGKESGRRFGIGFSGGVRTGIGPVRGIMRGFGPGLAAAFGGAALVSAIQSVTNEAREAAVVGRQTAAVLKSTGGVANVTAKDVDRLSTALSNQAGVDDELIATGQNLLLTFTGVRNEVGKGNNIFDQASQATLDMTAAMHSGNVTAQGLKASTIQVGKALNDPIKGMTALSRVGVTFTQGQKDQVKALVESGDKLGAQKIILAELRKEFGGSAAASADAGKRFQVFVGNLKEQVGAVLLPVLNRLLGFLVDKLPGAFRAVGNVIGGVVTTFKVFTGAFRDPDVTTKGFFGTVERLAGGMRSLWGTIVRLVVPAFGQIAAAMRPAIAAFVSGLLPGLRSLWRVLQAQVFPALKIVAAIIGVTLYAALRFVLPLVLRLAGPVLGALFKSMAFLIGETAEVIRFIGRLGAWFLRWITGTKTTGAAMKVLGERVGAFAASMSKQWQSVVRTVTGAMTTMRRVTVTVLAAMIRFWLRWAGNVVDAAATALGWMPGLGPKLRAAQQKFHTFAGSVNAALNKIQDEGVNVKIKGTFTPPKGWSGHTITGATGGFVTPRAILHRAGGGPIRMGSGPTADDVPAMLSRGEYVVNARATARHRGLIEAINRDGLPGLARGGGVDVNVLAPQMGRFGAGIQRLVASVAARTAATIQRHMRILVPGGGVGKAGILNFIKSVDPLPYVWGAAGPRAYDCSGLVGAVYGKMRGHAGAGRGTRFFTTGTIGTGTPGLKGGLGGTLQIGVTAGSGHMAGRYGGLGFEAESSRTGIKIGGAASRPESFARRFHMARGGLVEARALDALARAGVLDIGGDRDRMRINGKVLDAGGWLQPGVTMAVNNTSKAERVSPPGGEVINYTKLGRAVTMALRETPPVVYLDRQKVSRAIDDARLWNARR